MDAEGKRIRESRNGTGIVLCMMTFRAFMSSEELRNNFKELHQLPSDAYAPEFGDIESGSRGTPLSIAK